MAINTKLLVPAALGFSLVTVMAFVVYYVFKKEDEADDKPITSTKVNMIEVRVPKSIVPALIGRAGSNIKPIAEKSGAKIHFKKLSEKNYDVCVISGRSHATQIAETLVHDFIKQQSLIEDDYMPVPGWACGRIIGSGGETINLISHCSGARVKVEGHRGDLSAQRQISLRGTTEQIEMAKMLIAKCVTGLLMSLNDYGHLTSNVPEGISKCHSDVAVGYRMTFWNVMQIFEHVLWLLRFNGGDSNAVFDILTGDESWIYWALIRYDNRDNLLITCDVTTRSKRKRDS